MKPVLFGPAHSVYVRIARIVLEEKGVDHDHVAFDIFNRDDWPDNWLERHPFGQVPAFQHGNFRLYETRAITRYVDEAFDGPALQPADAKGRARVEQAISVLDAHGYRPMVWRIFVERVSRGQSGETDEGVVAEALPQAGDCLAALANILGDGAYFGGAGFGLADAHAAPIFDYFVKAPEGQVLLEAVPSLAAWWGRVGARESVRAACEGEGAA